MENKLKASKKGLTYLTEQTKEFYMNHHQTKKKNLSNSHMEMMGSMHES